MALPLCVKVDVADSSTRETLATQGWRYIGQLNTYFGEPASQTRWPSEIRMDEINLAQLVPALIGEIDWSGRLWRDRKVSEEDALAETLKVYYGNEAQTYLVGSSPAALAVFNDCRLLLIGVHPKARGLGLAKALVKNAMGHRENITAGTYSDNEAAIALYESLGMKQIKSQAVFHK